jgi:hypothetical protein
MFLYPPRFLDAPMFLYPPRFLDAPMFLYPPRFLDAPMFLYSPKFLDAPMFCICFAAPIFLCIFLHSYLVCANNLIGANILRFLG